MGKESGKKKKQIVTKRSDSNVKQKFAENTPRSYDMDMVVFISMAQEHKDEGNKLFQKRDYEGAMLKYEKALKLLPQNHIDVSYLRSNVAACYMQMGITEYPRAIHECNLALEVTPKYSKALLKRARCYEGLNRLDLALRDVSTVLKMEPKNLMASEIEERLRVTMEKKDPMMSEEEISSIPVPRYVDFDKPSASSRLRSAVAKMRRKKSKKFDLKITSLTEEEEDEENLGEKKNEEKVEENLEEMNNEEKVEEKRDEKQIDEEKLEEKKAEVKLVPEYVEIAAPSASSRMKSTIEKVRKKKKNKLEKKIKWKTEEKKDEEDLEEKKNEKKVEGKSDEENLEEKKAEDKLVPEYVEIAAPSASSRMKSTVEKMRKKKNNKLEKKFKGKTEEDLEEKKNAKKVGGKRDEEQIDEEKLEEKKAEDKLVVEEKISTISMEEEPKRIVKLVFGEDIRFAKVPFNCSVLKLREIIHDRFPGSKAILTKYRDQEGDLVTITTNEELRWAEASVGQHGSVKLFVVEVNPEQDPFYDKVVRKKERENRDMNGSDGAPTCIDDWIIQFAQLFKNYVGFNSDAYLDLHELGMKVYSEAMEDMVTSEEAQDLFNAAGDKFQEMAALALFNCGNVHSSKARKRVYFSEDASRESILGQVKVSYEWAQKEYSKAGDRYEEALKIKPDFYEGVLALGQQQFEQAKLSWYYAVGTNVDLETWDSAEVIQLYNYAEDNMEKGMQLWEETEKQRIYEVSRPSKVKLLLKKVSGGLIKDVNAVEAAEQAANMRSQIYLLWGTMLYERSIMEYKLGLPVWHECLEVAVEKFELAGASPTDIAVMVKNHCSNDTALEGLGFNIDEIIQAWNEMYEAKRWRRGVPSFRLEPLLRRRVSKLYHFLERA